MTQNTSIALLLEDEALIAMDIEQALGSAGYDVTTVLTCAQAALWLQTRRPDVVIVDVMLRDGTSEAIVSKLVQERIPFLVHSGDVPGIYAGTPFAHGVWVSKPASSSDLVEAANGLILAKAEQAGC